TTNMQRGTEPTGVPRITKRKESVGGEWSLMVFRELALIARSVMMALPAVSQVWGCPLRTRVSIPMKWIQSAVTGLLMSTLSPTLKPEALLTLTVFVPDGA